MRMHVSLSMALDKRFLSQQSLSIPDLLSCFRLCEALKAAPHREKTSEGTNARLVTCLFALSEHSENRLHAKTNKQEHPIGQNTLEHPTK